MRHPTPLPPERTGVHGGLSYALFEARCKPQGGLIIVHGAGSRKESHFDFARAAGAAGLASVVYDQRGHGESKGPLDDRLADDVVRMRELLGDGPVALRGSSMGGYVAIMAARRVGAAAVVAICPAGAEHLLRGLRSGDWEWHADVAKVEAFLEAHDLTWEVRALDAPLMLLHAEGDERIPVTHSIALHQAGTAPGRRLVVLPGGHHRSIQHDAEMQGESLRFIAAAFAANGAQPG
ncbi:MAG: alpha/beta hydrolase family protein [Solirubrobacteraceae bacterium]